MVRVDCGCGEVSGLVDARNDGMIHRNPPLVQAHVPHRPDQSPFRIGAGRLLRERCVQGMDPVGLKITLGKLAPVIEDKGGPGRRLLA